MKTLLKCMICGMIVSLIITITICINLFEKYNVKELNEQSITTTRKQMKNFMDENFYVPINPCITPSENTKNFSGTRTAKCITEIQSFMLTGECPSRLGNQMFSYATLFAIGYYNNRTGFMSPSMSDYISKYFNITLNTIDKKLYKTIKWSGMGLGGKVPNTIKNISKPYVKFVGVPQVWKYFDEIRPIIIQELKFYNHIIQSSKMTLENIKIKFYKNKNDIIQDVIIVGIHIRRGDYLKRAITAKFYLPTIEYYISAMEYFIDKYINAIFIVSSNDILWCKENFKIFLNDFNIYILDGATEKDGGLDLAILAHCDHLIFGLGTFGWWAGYLNPTGQVIYCSDCITEKTGWLRNKIIYNGDYRNVVLPTWIGYTRNGTFSSTVAQTTNIF